MERKKTMELPTFEFSLACDLGWGGVGCMQGRLLTSLQSCTCAVRSSISVAHARSL